MTEKQTTINVTMLTGKNSGYAELRGTTVERLIAVLTGDVEKAATICLKQIEKQIGHRNQDHD